MRMWARLATYLRFVGVPFSRLLFCVLSVLPACPQSPPHQRYIISIGTASEKVSSGKIWLYSYSWYGLLKI